MGLISRSDLESDVSSLSTTAACCRDYPAVEWRSMSVRAQRYLLRGGVAHWLMYYAPSPSLLHKMLTIHRQPTTRTLQLPPELLYKIITWVIAQSVHSIYVSSGQVEWDLKLMETLCLVSSAFRDIALEVQSFWNRAWRESSQLSEVRLRL